MLSKSNNIHSKPTRQVGFVLKAHGFKGDLRIQLDDDFKPSEYLLLEIHSKFVPFEIETYHSGSGIIKLKGIDNLDAVEELISLPILDFQTDSLSPQTSLIGFTLLDSLSGTEFEVVGILDLPGNTLLEFRHGYKEALLPLHEDIVKSIDYDNKRIVADFPDGILDL